METLRRALRLPLPLCSILAARGFRDPDEANRFLHPGLEELHPPDLLTDIGSAARRIEEAIDGREKILVHGDYDVDGIAGVALLARWLVRLGARVAPFVPHRLRDGYDLAEGGLRVAREAGATLIVTVDCGIRAHEVIAAAAREGIDVVVTDHHQPGPTLPPAAAVVNPNRADCRYPHGGLSGAGVAFKLCELLGRMRGAPASELHGHLDLVAMATIADLVPLRDENRAIARIGLERLRGTDKEGLRALISQAGLRSKAWGAGHVAFHLAPRINAAGRIGEASLPLRLLLTEDAADARGIARELERLNRMRREEDRRTLDQALALLADDFDSERDYGIVLAAEGWHPGVIGIAATRVVERLHRPTILIALDGRRGRGSGRSIGAFPLHEALDRCSDHLIRFGGHRHAAGLDIEKDEVAGFREAFRDQAKRALAGDPESLSPRRAADLEIGLAEAAEPLARGLERLGPFGIGNPRPLFLARDLALAAAPRVVGGRHLKLRLAQNGAELDAIGFGMAPTGSADLPPSNRFDAVFRLEMNTFRGRSSAQARLADLRAAGELP